MTEQIEAIATAIKLAAVARGDGNARRDCPFNFLIDPFCGDGELTIAVLGLRLASYSIASDPDQQSVQLAQKNALRAGVSIARANFLCHGPRHMSPKHGGTVFAADLQGRTTDEKRAFFIAVRRCAAPGDAIIVRKRCGTVKTITVFKKNHVTDRRRPFGFRVAA